MMDKGKVSTKVIAQMSTEDIQRALQCNSASSYSMSQMRARLYEEELKNRGAQIPVVNLCGGGSNHVPGVDHREQ